MSRVAGIGKLLALGAAVVLSAVTAQAEIRIGGLTRIPQPIPIAISDLVGDRPEAARVGKDIAQVVAADLERSGLFRPIEQAAFAQQADAIGGQPRFEDWRLIPAQALVSGNATLQPDGRLRAEFHLWDVGAEAQMEGQSLATQAQSWRRIAHKIADAIYKRITGENGYFDTEIAYVAESGPAMQRVKQLAIMDQDG
ncbi:MAG: Tol-Pal system protein TolB, partial [Alphaproteobacteria bacterium]|nr:Tol-Pal system protein TolB [Alphaproteobacteria bacterium]